MSSLVDWMMGLGDLLLCNKITYPSHLPRDFAEHFHCEWNVVSCPSDAEHSHMTYFGQWNGLQDYKHACMVQLSLLYSCHF